jgi:hypothetical protein
MTDIFDNTILCKDCDKQMKKIKVLKNGFIFRTLQCLHCNNKIVHPDDEREYKNYIHLRNKNYRVKMRMVGNSYTISIPREIVNFINEQNRVMDDMVRLSMEKMGKLSLVFDELTEDKKTKNHKQHEK